MCLIVFAWKTHPGYHLMLAANRDELHQRPSRDLGWWPDRPDVLAGRDLQAGGTWLAASRAGKFAAVTNYREQQRRQSNLRSRGDAVTNFVTGETGPGSYCRSLSGEDFGGFSLLAADGEDMFYVSNRGDDPVPLSPGIYGLSNASLDTPWPKLLRSRDALKALVESGNGNETELMRLMADRRMAQAPDVDTEAMPFRLARALTAPFIVSPEYGTRCTTVLLWSHAGEITVCERRFDPAGDTTGQSRFRFEVRAG